MLAARRERHNTYSSKSSTCNTGFPTVSPLQPSPHRSATGIESYDLPSPDDIDVTTLPIPLQNLFQRIYFACMFNSTMLFHPPTFYRLFEEGKVPLHNLSAMYAMATM